MSQFFRCGTSFQLAIAGLGFWFCGCATAAEMTASCPSRIPGNVVKPNQALNGWTTTVAEQLHLSAAGMLAGPPDTKAYLVPQKRTEHTHMYTFEVGSGERWFWCSYGSAGGVELARRLDDRATRCTITSRTRKLDSTMSAAVVCE